MFEFNIRLVSMIGILTILVTICLLLDYFKLLRRPMRLAFWVAILGILTGTILTYYAVMPANNFYGTVFSHVQTTKKIVALTFDDGPYPPYTDQLLVLLKEYDVPATFFIVGKNAEKHPETLRNIVAEGHQIGNHTYHHVDLLKADRDTIVKEIDRTNEVIASIVGFQPHVVRPPHGFRDPVVMEVMKEKKLTVVGWSVMSRDWLNPGIDMIVNRTMAKITNGSIILLHDGDGIAQEASRMQTLAATRLLIEKLKAEGYTFVTVDEIVKNGGTEFENDSRPGKSQ